MRTQISRLPIPSAILALGSLSVRLAYNLANLFSPKQPWEVEREWGFYERSLDEVKVHAGPADFPFRHQAILTTAAVP